MLHICIKCPCSVENTKRTCTCTFGACIRVFVCVLCNKARAHDSRARSLKWMITNKRGGAEEKNTCYLEVLTGDDAVGLVCLLVTAECVCLRVEGHRGVCVWWMIPVRRLWRVPRLVRPVHKHVHTLGRQQDLQMAKSARLTSLAAWDSSGKCLSLWLPGESTLCVSVCVFMHVFLFLCDLFLQGHSYFIIQFFWWVLRSRGGSVCWSGVNIVKMEWQRVEPSSH